MFRKRSVIAVKKVIFQANAGDEKAMQWHLGIGGKPVCCAVGGSKDGEGPVNTRKTLSLKLKGCKTNFMPHEMHLHANTSLHRILGSLDSSLIAWKPDLVDIRRESRLGVWLCLDGPYLAVFALEVELALKDSEESHFGHDI